MAAGALAGYGEGMVEDARAQREQALEELRQQRRQAERTEDRGWNIEDRGYTEDRADKRAKTAEVHQDKRDEFSLKRDNARYDQQDKTQAQRDAAADERDRNREDNRDRREAARADKPKSPGQIIAPILDKIAKSGKKSLSAGELEALDTYQKVTAEQRYKNSIYDDMGDGGSGGGEPDAASSVGPAGTSAPTIAPRSTAPAVKQAVSTPSAEASPRIVPQRYIDLLTQNPDRAGEFDAKFGAGASKRYLGQQ